MSSKQRSQPPDIPGFTHRSWLGGGGFADVFLYAQQRPAREVAVKVLRSTSLDDGDLRAFDAEADLMARVSAHPYIVTIYEADVAPDGRPYFVMEYYSRPHFGQRSRQSPLGVPEVLRVGVRVASAVETAHRAGIVHRDIKPANILVNHYDRPGLTDFGIGGTREGSVLEEAQGVTVAYAPAEVLLEESPGDELGDVYSLAATLYALLAGRAPFEVTGGDNTSQAVLSRTLSAPIQPLGREDVPRTLTLLLEQAMAKEPAHRPRSAAALGRALQGIERELQLAVTEFELAGDVPQGPDRSVDDAEGTRASRIQVVRPDGPTAPPRTAGSAPRTSHDTSHTVAAGPGAAPIAGVPRSVRDQGSHGRVPSFASSATPIGSPPGSETISRAPSAPPATSQLPTGAAARRAPVDRRRLALLGGAAAVVVAVVLGLVLSSQGGDGGGGTTTTTRDPDDDDFVVPTFPDVPIDVRVQVTDGVATITWDPGVAEAGDEYLISRVLPEGPSPVARVSETTTQVRGIGAGEDACFNVLTERGARQSETSEDACG